MLTESLNAFSPVAAETLHVCSGEVPVEAPSWRLQPGRSLAATRAASGCSSGCSSGWSGGCASGCTRLQWLVKWLRKWLLTHVAARVPLRKWLLVLKWLQVADC